MTMLQFTTREFFLFYELNIWAPCYEYQNMILIAFKYNTSVDTIKAKKNVNGVPLNRK